MTLLNTFCINIVICFNCVVLLFATTLTALPRPKLILVSIVFFSLFMLFTFFLILFLYRLCQVTPFNNPLRCSVQTLQRYGYDHKPSYSFPQYSTSSHTCYYRLLTMVASYYYYCSCSDSRCSCFNVSC